MVSACSIWTKWVRPSSRPQWRLSPPGQSGVDAELFDAELFDAVSGFEALDVSRRTPTRYPISRLRNRPGVRLHRNDVLESGKIIPRR